MKLGDAIKLFVQMPLAIEAAKHAALDQAGEIIQTEAKRVIGTFDYGWPPLADSTVERKGHDDPLIDYSSANPGSLIRDTIERQHTSINSIEIGSNSDVAVYNELGTVHAPPRSFLAGAAKAKGEEAAETVGRAIVITGIMGRKLIP